MFDILTGRKFSNKCKHSVKYIKCRIETIRKKKQVMVRYLKKDVADLLAGNHDANAFGRIDALIIEINHASCYDMIEQYCGCLLENISTMCKQRECPKEAMEAIATLIFAAARFSDLPELADLRSVFTKRYGTLMESCIDKEGNPMKHQLVNKANEKQFPGSAPQKHQIQPKEQIDFQTTPTDVNMHAHDRTEKTVKMTADVLEDAKFDHPDKKANFRTKYKQNELIFDGNARGRFVKVHEGIGLVDTERQPSTDAVNRDFKAINTIPPPYTKLPECSNGSIAIHGNFPSSEASEDVKEFDHRPINAPGRRTFNSQPPYRKPNVSKSPNGANYVNPADYEKPTEDQGNDHFKDKMPKCELFEDDANPVSQIQTKQGREITRTNGLHGDAYDQQKFIIKQTPSNRQRHGSRRTVQATKDGGCDKEEEVMDKLLMHYSKKGSNDEPSITRATMRGAPKDPVADAARVPENLDDGKRHHNTLPQEQTCPAENFIKSRTRAASKQTWIMPLRPPEDVNLAA